ncbi:MAG TPA: hypothetical protein VFS24_08700, partial [Steroidobacteraceae bacterium]|nr:hypothetical protein [Steroidobacteraceae bacterium]
MKLLQNMILALSLACVPLLSAFPANEIGYWNGGAGATSETLFTGGQSYAPVGGTAIHTAGAGE